MTDLRHLTPREFIAVAMQWRDAWIMTARQAERDGDAELRQHAYEMAQVGYAAAALVRTS